MASFSAQVDAWTAETIDRTERVFKASAQDVIADAQVPTAKGGRMRVDTGTLRNSLTSGLNGSTSLTGPEAYKVALQAKLGDVINGGWTADYAVHREFGARGQAPDFFLRGAAQKWPQIVKSNAAKANARAAG